MQIQLLHLYYFKVLAENEHMLKTAEQLHISAPALSSIISKLERELNTTLFNRVGRNIKLNKNGEIVYNHACKVFNEIDLMEKELHETSAIDQTIINVGVTAMTLWNEMIADFAIDHPEVLVNQSIVHEDMLSHPEVLGMLDCIIAAEIDFGKSGWKKKMLMYDPPVLLVNKTHKFASLDKIALKDAKDENFVALTKGYTSRTFMDYSCKLAGFEPKISAEADYMLRSRLVANGSGIAFSSVQGFKMLSPGLVMVRVDENTPPRKQCIFYPESKANMVALKNFIKYAVDYFKE